MVIKRYKRCQFSLGHAHIEALEDFAEREEIYKTKAVEVLIEESSRTNRHARLKSFVKARKKLEGDY